MPPSSSHKNGDWSPNDLYIGELAMDEKGHVYTRTPFGIRLFMVGKIYRGVISQSGTSAPTVTIFDNTIGSIVWARLDQGRYRGTLSGAFPANATYAILSVTSVDTNVAIYRENNNIIRVETKNSSTLAWVDGALSEAAILIQTYP